MFKEVACNYAIKLDKDIEPVAEVHSNEQFIVNTVNAYGSDFETLTELQDLISGKYGTVHHHPLTGPINVAEARVGDVLKVDIQHIHIKVMGQALSRSAGIDPISDESFHTRSPIISYFDESAGDIKYTNGMHIQYRPMLGMIGNAPAGGIIKTGHAGKTGGNLDIPFVTENVSVYIPVKVDGAKLFIGDAHGSQGYGELGGVALEASARVKLKVEVLKPRKEFSSIVVVGKEPLTDKNAIGIVGVADTFSDLNRAVLDAYRSTIDIIQQMFPNLNRTMVCNLVTVLGHSMNGQAFSKTSESTSIINILEDDLKKMIGAMQFNIKETFESVMFKWRT